MAVDNPRHYKMRPWNDTPGNPMWPWCRLCQQFIYEGHEENSRHKALVGWAAWQKRAAAGQEQPGISAAPKTKVLEVQDPGRGLLTRDEADGIMSKREMTEYLQAVGSKQLIWDWSLAGSVQMAMNRNSRAYLLDAVDAVWREREEPLVEIRLRKRPTLIEAGTPAQDPSLRRHECPASENEDKSPTASQLRQIVADATNKFLHGDQCEWGDDDD